MDPKARFLQGPENSSQIDNGAGALTVGDPVVSSAGLSIAGSDGGRLLGVCGEDFAANATDRLLTLCVPGSIWLFSKASGTSVAVDASVALAGSGLVDGGSSSNPGIGYRVPHAAEDSTHIAVRIEPHTIA
jgi:hypothetical protein